MSLKNLDAVFRPRSIVLIGTTAEAGTLGAVLLANLTGAGFKGTIQAVHRTASTIDGLTVFQTVADLPQAPDLAVVASPCADLAGDIRALAERGCRAALILSGLCGDDTYDSETRAAITMATGKGMRILGPNCVGIIVPGVGLNASTAHMFPKKGQIAFITQSGAVAYSVMDWAAGRGIGFSHVLSIGDMADVDVGDMLDQLALDQSVAAIVIYAESVTNARHFMSAARAASRLKPVVVMKSGRHPEGARAAASHTGAMIGSDAVYDAAMRRAGLLRVHDLEELFAAVEVLGHRLNWRGERLAIITNGGGIGVLAADAAAERGARLSELTEKTLIALNEALPQSWPGSNPIDIGGDATGARYAAVLGPVLADPEVDAVLLLNCPTAIGNPTEAAQAVIAAHKQLKSAKPVLTCWTGGPAAAAARGLFVEAKLATFDTPEDAVRGFAHMIRHRANQAQLTEAPASIPDEAPGDAKAVAELTGLALHEGRDWLTEIEAKQVLAAYHIPCVRTRKARTPAEVFQAAQDLGGPVAVKILSHQIVHKSDVGGVALNLETPDEAKEAATAMLRRVQRLIPDARVYGFTVQDMVRRAGAQELIVGMSVDPAFGPVILFGQGGVAVEAMGDVALALPPLNPALARELMSRTRIDRLLDGYRNIPAANRAAIEDVLVRVGQLIADRPEIAEIDINPLLASAQGVIALDARIRVARPTAQRRFAILPYPRQLEHILESKDGLRFKLRPVRPEDANAFYKTFEHLDSEDVRLRFFSPLKSLPATLVSRLTQIDYDREMNFVIVPEHVTDENKELIFGLVQLACDPDNIKGEYAVLVRSDWKGHGLGARLMEEIISYGRSRGLRIIEGSVLRANQAMLGLCRELGFHVESNPDDLEVMDVTLYLDPEAAEKKVA